MNAFPRRSGVDTIDTFSSPLGSCAIFEGIASKTGAFCIVIVVE